MLNEDDGQHPILIFRSDEKPYEKLNCFKTSVYKFD